MRQKKLEDAAGGRQSAKCKGILDFRDGVVLRKAQQEQKQNASTRGSSGWAPV